MRGCEEIYLENTYLTDGIDMLGVILLEQFLPVTFIYCFRGL